jgi:hypothetical protein
MVAPSGGDTGRPYSFEDASAADRRKSFIPQLLLEKPPAGSSADGLVAGWRATRPVAEIRTPAAASSA